MILELSPSLCSFTDANGATQYGGNQDWYRDPWQQKAGCGPTTAAFILHYLSHYSEEYRALCSNCSTTADILALMEEVWNYVTPGNRGLNRPSMFYDGCLRFSEEKGCSLQYTCLEIPGRESANRPDLETCLQFLVDSIGSNCPVAFLNFSNGHLQNLDSWHWVPIVSVEARENTVSCVILDGGLRTTIDFSLWLRTTFFGGALVSIMPQKKP